VCAPKESHLVEVIVFFSKYRFARLKKGPRRKFREGFRLFIALELV